MTIAWEDMSERVTSHGKADKKEAIRRVGRGNETNYKGKILAKKEIRVTHHIGGSGVPVGLADNGRIKDKLDVDDIRTAHWTGKSSSFPLSSSQPSTNKPAFHH